VRGAPAGASGRYDGQKDPSPVGSPSARMPSPFETGTLRGNTGGFDERSRLLDQALGRGGHHGHHGHHGHKSPQDKNSMQGMHLQTIAAMVMIPWLMFFTISMVVALAPATSLARGLAWSVALLCLGFSLLLLQVYLHSGAPIYKYVGSLGVVAVVLASVSGSTAYDKYTLRYWMGSSRARANNVEPSLPAMGYSNSAALTFTPDTGVDLVRSLGYKGIETGGTVYCVAPILDAAAADVDEVRFWAIGQDCCMPTWGFRCGPVGNPAARSGVVLRKMGSHSSREMYQIYSNAAHQAAALYHLRTSEDPVFVSWTLDPEADLGNLFSAAVLSVSIGSVLYMIVSLFIAGGLHWLAGRPPKDWQRIPRGLGSTGLNMI